LGVKFLDQCVDFIHTVRNALPVIALISLLLNFFECFPLLFDPGKVFEVVNTLAAIVGQLLPIVDGHPLQMPHANGSGVCSGHCRHWPQ
jgi:hypothetical protein